MIKTVFPLSNINVCDNRYGFDLGGFSDQSVASLLNLDCAIAVYDPKLGLLIHVDTGEWFRYKGEVEGTDESVNKALSTITFNPDDIDGDDEAADPFQPVIDAFINTGKWEIYSFE